MSKSSFESKSGNCPDADLLSEYVSGGLSDLNAQSQLAIHLDTCAKCMRTLASLDKQFDSFAAALKKNAVATPASVAESVGNSHVHDKFSAEFPDIEDYRIVSKIGQGGMGVVYQAEQISLGRRVALKTMRMGVKDYDLGTRRFQLEARTAAQLHHSNIVPVYEVGVENDTFYYAMQFIEGRGLDSIIEEARKLFSASPSENVDSLDQQLALTMLNDTKKNDATIANQSVAHSNSGDNLEVKLPNQASVQRRIPRKRAQSVLAADLSWSQYCNSAARIGQQVASALGFAHSRGVIHRDIKPANLLMDLDSQVWVADFGLVKTETTDFTQTGDVVGTLRYMSPERFDGICDERSDVYSLGLTLYEILALKPAYEASGNLSLLEKIRTGQPKPLREINPNIPFDLQTIVGKAIEKDASRRYLTATEMADDLARFLDGRPILARRVSSVERLFIWSRRNPLVASLVSLLGIVLLGSAIGSTYAAFTFRDMANRENQLKQDAILVAEERARELYFSRTREAFELYRTSGSVAQLRKLLKEMVPEGDETDHRNWEWYWLNSITEHAHTIINHDDLSRIRSMDLSPDKKHICWARGNALMVATWPELSFVSTLFSSAHVIPNARFSPDGNWIAVASLENKLRIWDWRKAKLVKEFEFDDNQRTWALCWKPNGQQLVVQTGNLGTRDPVGELYVFSTDNWNQIARIKNNCRDFITNIEFNADGSLLAVGGTVGGDFNVRLFDTNTWRLNNEKTLHNYPVKCVAWHPDQKQIACGGADQTVKVWNTETDSVRLVYEGIYPTSVQWNRDGNQLMFSGDDDKISAFIKTDGTKQQFVGHENCVNCFAVDQTRGLLASSDEGAQMRIWNINDAPMRHLKVPDKYKLSDHFTISWSKDDQTLAVSHSGANKLWDVRTGKAYPPGPQPPQLGHDVDLREDDYSVRGTFLTWLSNGSFVVVRYYAGLQIWNADATELIREVHFEKQKGPPTILCALPDDKLLMLFDPDDNTFELKTLDIQTGKLNDLLSKKRDIHVIACGPDGQLVCFTRNSELYIFDILKKQIVKTIDFEKGAFDSLVNITANQWSKDGRYLAVGLASGNVRILDTSSWQIIQELEGHTAAPLSIDWHNSGTRLATGSRDRTLRIWDIESGNSVLTIPQDADVRFIKFAHQKDSLAVVTDNGSVSVYDASIGYQRANTEPSVEAIETDQGNFSIRRYQFD